MFQSLLLVALGFLVASLLALLSAPLLWRRAQKIMRRQLEAVVPMSLEDVRADRDALRAEHAMAMRRLEIENEEVRRIDAEHVIEIGRGKEALKERADTISRRDARITALEKREDQLTAQLRKREKDLSALEVTARTSAREVARQRERAETIASSLQLAEKDGTAQIEELDALKAETADLNARLVEVSSVREALEREVAELRENAVAVRSADDADLRERLREAEQRAEETAKALERSDVVLRPKLLALGERLTALVAYLEAGNPDGRSLEHRMQALIEGAEANPSDTLSADEEFDQVAAEFDLAAEQELERFEEEREPERRAG